MKIYISLYYKALLAILAILLPILVTFFITFEENKRHIKDQTLQDLTIVADAYEGLTYQFLHLIKQRAEGFASDGLIRDQMEKAITGNSADIDKLAGYLTKDKKPLESMINAIHIISLDGKIVASTDKKDTNLSVLDKKFFTEGRQQTAANVTLLSANAKKELVISTPIKRRTDGEIIGVLANTISPSVMGEVLSGDFFIKLGAITYGAEGRQTLESYLVNYEGELIASSKKAKGQNGTQKILTEPVIACKETNTELSDFYESHSGAEVAGASMCLPYIKWVLIVEIDKKEVLYSVEKMKKSALLATSIIGSIIGIMFMFFNRAIISPISRFSKAAGKIAEGDYDTLIPETKGLIGEDELTKLSKSFNIMSREIKKSTEAARESEKRLVNAQRIANIGNWVWDIESNALYWYDEVYNIFGINKGEAQPSYELFLKAVHNEDRPMVERRIKEALEERKPYSVDHRIILQGGTERFVHEEAEVEYDSQGKAVRMVGTIQDISTRKKNEDEIEKGYYVQNVLRGILQNSMGELSLEKQLDHALGLMLSISWFSFKPKAAIFLTEETDDKQTLSLKTHRGFSEEEISACKTLPFGTGCCGRAAQNRKIVFAAVGEPCSEVPQTASEPSSCYSAPILSRDKVLGVINVYLEPKHKEDYSEREFLFSMASILAGIIERKNNEFELKKLSTAIEQSESIILITSPTGNIEYVNRKFEETTGYKKEDVLGQNSKMLASGETDKDTYQDLWETVIGGDAWRGTFRNKTKEGGFYWADITVSPIMNEKREVTSLLIIQEDITEKRRSEERLRYLTSYDKPTGLLNRSSFEEKVNDICRQLEDENSSGAFILIDIDSLKSINDAFGHEAGDKFIRLTADTVKSTIDQIDASGGMKQKALTCRLGADEFGIFIPSIDENKSLEIGNLIRKNVEDMHIEDIPAKITISVGISKTSKDSSNFRDLITRADAAIIMLRTKGRNECAIYRQEDQVLENMYSNLATKGRIQKTLDEGRFEIWYQPILCVKKGTIKHYEVLVRMREEDGSILSPGTFINVAEIFGMIGSIDRIVAEKTMVKQAALGKKGKHITFSINLSGKDLGDERLLSFLQKKIVETGADPNHLVFEITETEAIHDLSQAVKFVTELKSIGCQFSLDDFGVGFTSFIYLKQMLVDFIKIDGSFIKNLCNSKDDQVVVKSIIDVAKGMGVKTVAEFVETQESLDLLSGWGIDYAQGYLIGKPKPDPRF